MDSTLDRSSNRALRRFHAVLAMGTLSCFVLACSESAPTAPGDSALELAKSSPAPLKEAVMYRLRSIVAFAIALLLLACSDTPREPVSPELEVSGPQLSAVVETFQGRFPLGPNTFFNACTGENVTIAGDFNVVFRQVTSNSGRVNVVIHSVGMRVKGVGESGTEYVYNEHFNYAEHSGDDGATNLIIEFTGRLVSQGKSTNGAAGKLQIFLVIDANGDVTIDRFVERGFDECQS